MAIKLNSSIGKISLLAKNSRIIRDNAFERLVESIKRDPQFLMARGIVVWQVPEVLSVPTGTNSPFVGQEGELVIIGGNQRAKAFLALGMTELDDKWLVEAKDENGNWWSPEAAERFVLLDNNPEGIAGENNLKEMFKNFSQLSIKLAGIDFSEFTEMMDESAVTSPIGEAEKGDNGEKNESLKTFIEHREQTRANLKEIDETGFHLLLVFDSFEQKVEFISKSGLTGKDGVVSVNGDVYLDLVFESYDQKMEFCSKAKLLDEDEEGRPLKGVEEDDGAPIVMYDMFADGRKFAKKFGIELKASLLHFRDRKVDAQLSDLAMEDSTQMSERELQEKQFADAAV